MVLDNSIIIGLVVLIVGIVIGFIIRIVLQAASDKSKQREALNAVETAQRQADNLLKEAEIKAKEFLFQSTDGKDLTTQGNFTGHRHIGFNRNSGQGRHQGGTHTDTGAGPVLGYRTFRHMDVNILFLKDFIIDTENFRTTTYHR